MTFSGEEISTARMMRDSGLGWEPAVGHFVFDETALIELPSPFQPSVFFILDMKHFLRRSGDVETLKKRMFWLPAWSDAREIARRLEIADHVVRDRLISERAIERGKERLVLYKLILENLSGRPC